MPPANPPSRRNKPRVFIDADVLFAGAASPQEHSASLVVQRMAEIGLIEALTCQQVIVETERSLAEKLPEALAAFRMLVSRSLRLVPDPSPADLLPYIGLAQAEDLPILVAALRENCPWLVTFNLRHFQPEHSQVLILRPGDLVLRVRDALVHLRSEETG